MNGVQQQELNEQLFNAIDVGEVEKVKRLIEERGVDPNIQNSSGITPLYFTLLRVALGTSQLGIVKFLVEVGADVKAGIGLTPLHLAVLGSMCIDNTEILEALIQAGADTEMADEDVMTPLHIAVEKGSIGCSKTLIKYTVLLNYGATKPDYIVNNTELSQIWDDCKREVKKIEKESQKLHSFLKEGDINKLISMWERNADIQAQIDDQDNLKEQYPKYACILINKADKVKGKIFLYNQEPLIDFLSTHCECDFKTMTLTGIENFFKVHRNDFRRELGGGGITLINFVDFEDITVRHIPKLKVQGFAEGIRSNALGTNLESSNAEQIQGVGQAPNIY